MPLYRIAEEMPVSELMMWQAYMTREPRGVHRGDWQAAVISKMVHDVGQSFSKARKDIPVKKFLLEFEEQVFGQEPSKDLANLRGIFPGVIPEGEVQRAQQIETSQEVFRRAL